MGLYTSILRFIVKENILFFELSACFSSTMQTSSSFSFMLIFQTSPHSLPTKTDLVPFLSVTERRLDNLLGNSSLLSTWFPAWII